MILLLQVAVILAAARAMRRLLVVLNIGIDAGVLSPTAFSMLVIMALTTTIMTSPLLNLFRPRPGSAIVDARSELLQRAAVDLPARVDR